MARTIAIGGFMGVGKSTVGRLLARRLGLPFVDLDEAIERHCGRSVSQIFEEDGEAHFREVEEQALKAALGGSRIVLSLGGGTLHQPKSLAYLQARADIVVLWLPFEALRGRLGEQDSTRPLWAQSMQIFVEREQGYRAAGAVVDVHDLDPDGAVDAVERVLACA